MSNRCVNGCRCVATIEKNCSCGRNVQYCESCAKKYQCNFCDAIPCASCWSFETCEKCSKIGAGFCFECGQKLFPEINCRICNDKIK